MSEDILASEPLQATSWICNRTSTIRAMVKLFGLYTNNIINFIGNDIPMMLGFAWHGMDDHESYPFVWPLSFIMPIYIYVYIYFHILGMSKSLITMLYLIPLVNHNIIWTIYIYKHKLAMVFDDKWPARSLVNSDHVARKITWLSARKKWMRTVFRALGGEWSFHGKCM